MSKILVTGGSGFVGSHAVLQLLSAGHHVNTTIRNLNREEEVRSMLRGAGESGDRLTFFAADLTEDAGWPEAVAACDYVLHIASPFPTDTPKNEDDLIVPARDGALRVLRAARNAGVRRVVLTSSFAAIGYGHTEQQKPFDESDWTELDPGLPAYIKSKTIAERAAWDFMATEGGELELSVINPVGIFGPVLGPDYSASVAILKRLMDGMPGYPRLYFGVVDVRDVVDLHIRAMTHPSANGQRFLAVSGDCLSMFDVAAILKSNLGVAARNVPSFQLPDWVVRFAAMFVPSMRAIVPQLGKMRSATNEKAKHLLGWAPRSNEEVIVATAESLLRFGLLNGDKN